MEIIYRALNILLQGRLVFNKNAIFHPLMFARAIRAVIARACSLATMHAKSAEELQMSTETLISALVGVNSHVL